MQMHIVMHRKMFARYSIQWIIQALQYKKPSVLQEMGFALHVRTVAIDC